MINRGWIVYGTSAFLLLLVFFIFVAAGWPGTPDTCTNIDPKTGVQVPQKPGDPANTCYCEDFSVSAVVNHKSGIRQPVNTLFNLYALLTAALVAWQVKKDRVNGDTQNPMRRTTSWIPDVYIFAVLFLGLGSMWFHASLTQAVSWMDGLSMYIFAGFLAVYAMYRFCSSGTVLWIFPRWVLFSVLYPLIIIFYTVIGDKVDLGSSAPLPISAWLIGTLIVLYLGFEIANFVVNRPYANWDTGTAVYCGFMWFGGVVAFGLAFLFWAESQTGKPLCNPTSFFQPHGLLWHPLAGVMAVLLFYYWRQEDDHYQPTGI